MTIQGRIADSTAMPARYILSEYLDRAIAEAEFDKLEDGSFVGCIPACKGVIAFGATLRACANELRSTLEDWLFLGLKLGHSLPVVKGLNVCGCPAPDSLISGQ